MTVNFLNKLSSFYRNTLIYLAVTGSTSEDWSAQQKIAFDEAKQLSDFAGMLVRLGFLWLAFKFFSFESEKLDLWPQGWILGVCAAFTFGLYFVLVLKIAKVISIYWLSGSANAKSRGHRWTISILSMVQTGIAVFGISKLAQAIAKASTIIH